MSIDYIITLILGTLTALSALMVVISRHPVRSVLFLIVTFFLISGNYVMMNAQFIAIVNLIVYAGAIMVLFLFVLMLLNLRKEHEPKISMVTAISATIAGGVLFIVLLAALKDSLVLAQITEPVAENQGLVKNLGRLLFDKYVLPFEVSSVLFIAAMAGAVLLAKRESQIIE